MCEQHWTTYLGCPNEHRSKGPLKTCTKAKVYLVSREKCPLAEIETACVGGKCPKCKKADEEKQGKRRPKAPSGASARVAGIEGARGGSDFFEEMGSGSGALGS